MPDERSPHSRAQEWIDKTARADWSTERQATRMGKSGYAPKKAELADMVLEGRYIVRDLLEQLEAVREQSGEVLEIREQTISDLQEQLEALGDSFVRWYLAEVFDDEAEAREEWEHIASYPATEPEAGA